MTRTHCGAGHFLTKLRHLPLQPLNCKIRHPGRPWTDAAARVGRTGTRAGGGPSTREMSARPAGRVAGRSARRPAARVRPSAAAPASLARDALRCHSSGPPLPPGPSAHLHTRKRCRQGDDRVTLSCSRWVPGRDGRCAPGPCSGSSGDPVLLAVTAEGQDTDRVPEPPEGAGPGHRVCCPSRAQASRT